MSDHHEASDHGAPTHRHHSDDSPVTWLDVDDQTILFSVESEGEWIQTDATVELADVA